MAKKNKRYNSAGRLFCCIAYFNRGVFLFQAALSSEFQQKEKAIIPEKLTQPIRKIPVKIMMREISELTIAGICRAAAKKYNKRIAFEIYRQGKICCLTSYRLLGIRHRQFALLLHRLGIRAGSRVLLMAENQPEWAEAWFGIALAGAVCISAGPDTSDKIIKHIFAHTELSAICLSRRYEASCRRAMQCAGIENSVPVIIITDISNLPQEEPETTNIFPRCLPDDTAVLHYTIDPAGTVQETSITNYELIKQAFTGRIKIFPRDRLLSTISLANTGELSRGLLRAAAGGALTVFYDEELSPHHISDAAMALRPTIMRVLPGLVTEYRDTIIEPALKADPFYRHPLTKILAYRKAEKKLLATLGKYLRCLEIEGTLPDDIKIFFDKIKFPYS